MLLKNWFRSLQQRLLKPATTLRRRPHQRPESLEQRLVLATWDGGGGNNLWSTAANWAGDVAPVNGEAIIFAGTARLTPDFDMGGFVFQSIQFDAGGFTINSSLNQTINLTGGGSGITVRNNAGANAFNTDVNFTTDGQIVVAGGTSIAFIGDLSANGAITTNFSNGQVIFGLASNPLITPDVQVTSTAGQTWNVNVRLAGNTTFTDTGFIDPITLERVTNDIVFNSTIDSVAADTLREMTTLNDAQVQFNGIVGGTFVLNTLTTGEFSDPTDSSVLINANVTTQSTTRNGVTVNGNQTYNNAVFIQGQRTLSVSDALPAPPANQVPTVAAGDIIFGGTVDSNGLLFTTDRLTLNTSGVTQFNGMVGFVNPLDRITTNFTGLRVDEYTILNTTYFAANAILFADPLIVAQDVVVEATGLPLGFGTALASGDVFFNAGISSRNADRDQFSSETHSLTVNAQGRTRFGDGQSTTIGTGFNAVVVEDYIGFDPYFSAFNSDFAFNVSPELLSLTTDADGTTIFNIVNSDTLFPSVTTEGSQTYGDDVVITAFTVLQSNGDAFLGDQIAFQGSVTGTQALEVNTAADTLFGDGDATDIVDLASLTTDNVNGFISGGSTIFNITADGADVLTDGNQSYGDAVQLMARTDFASDGAVNGNITFGSTLDTADAAAGAASATVITSGLTQFFGNVGVNRRLETLLTDGGGITQFRDGNLLDPSNEISVQTTDFQEYLDRIQLEVTTNFNNQTHGRMFFRNQIDSLNVATPAGMRVRSDGPMALGDGIGNDFIGSVAPLAFLETTQGDLGDGTTQINIRNSTVSTPSILTTGHQSYATRLQLVLDTVMNSTNSPLPGDILFFREIDNFVPTVARKLSVNSGGTTNFSSRVGTLASPLATLFTDEPGYSGASGVTRFDVASSTIVTPSVSTIGVQRYGDAVKLSNATVLRSVQLGGDVGGTGNIEFHGRLDALFTGNATMSLEVYTGGNTDFGDGDRDYVGSEQALTSLVTDSAGVTRFNVKTSGNPGQTAPPTVRTVGAQIFNDQVTLLQYTSLDSTSSTVTFNDRISGTPLLTVDLPLSGPWFDATAGNTPVRVIQDGTTVLLIDKVGNKLNGSVNSATNPSSGSVPGLSFTINGDEIRFSNGTVWLRTNLAGNYSVNGQVATIDQAADTLVIRRPDGVTSEGRFISHNQVVADLFGDLVGTVNGNTVTFSNGQVYTPFRLSPTYTYNGKPTQVVQQGLNTVLVNEFGLTSTATFLSTTLIRADQWNIVGQIVNGQILWSNNTVWNKNLSFGGTNQFNQPVGVNITNNSFTIRGANGQVVNARALNSTTIQAFGTTGTIQGNRIIFGNGQIFNFRQQDLNALFSDVSRFPFPA